MDDFKQKVSNATDDATDWADEKKDDAADWVDDKKDEKDKDAAREEGKAEGWAKATEDDLMADNEDSTKDDDNGML